LTSQPRRFDLAEERRAISVHIHVHAGPVHANPCSDVLTAMPAESIWEAVSGIVDVDLSRSGIDSGGQHRLRATVRILAAEFVGPSGKGVRLSRPIVLTAVVGGWSG